MVIPVAASDGVNYHFTPEQRKSPAAASKGKVTWQKRFGRRKKGSSNRRRAVNRIARYQRKSTDIRNDFAHKASKAIVESSGSLLVFENLRIKNMTA